MGYRVNNGVGKWSEEKTLRKLNITDFHELTKVNIPALGSMLDKMDPEVAKKALDQFPEFSSAVREELLDYKEHLNNILDSNEKSVNTYYQTCDKIIQELGIMLKDASLSFEQKRYIIEQMHYISKDIEKKDRENKYFLLKLASIASFTLVAVTATLATTLGGKLPTGKNEQDDRF